MADLKNLDWKRLVGGVAPTIAAVFGTPMLGAAVAALSEAVLGRSDGTEEEIADVFRTGSLKPEQLAQVRLAEIAFKQRMEELQIDVLKLEADTEKAYLLDTQDARARQVATGDWMPQIILVALAVLYGLQFYYFATGSLPADEVSRTVLIRAFGTVDALMAGAVQYFIGSSRGSKRAGDTVRTIAEKSTTPPTLAKE